MYLVLYDEIKGCTYLDFSRLDLSPVKDLAGLVLAVEYKIVKFASVKLDLF